MTIIPAQRSRPIRAHDVRIGDYLPDDRMIVVQVVRGDDHVTLTDGAHTTVTVSPRTFLIVRRYFGEVGARPSSSTLRADSDSPELVAYRELDRELTNLVYSCG